MGFRIGKGNTVDWLVKGWRWPIGAGFWAIEQSSHRIIVADPFMPLLCLFAIFNLRPAAIVET